MGAATARILSEEHTVVLCDVDQQRLDRASDELRDLGIKSETAMCDVTDRGSVEEVATRATALGTVVSVVHRPGRAADGERRDILAVNAVGTVHVNQAFLPLAHEGFSIVSVASTAGHMSAKLLSKRDFGRGTGP